DGTSVARHGGVARLTGPMAFMAVLAITSSSLGQVVYEQLPTSYGGPASDTAFLDFLGRPATQLIADDFSLSQPANLRGVRWCGFYNEDNPPPVEAMRVRFYSPRSADGLPGDLLYEETFVDAARTA